MKVGDEPVLIAKRTNDQFPIWVFSKRHKSIQALLKNSPEVNVIISDEAFENEPDLDKEEFDIAYGKHTLI
jgi:tetraacyldisaccharide 4'-kinase